MGPGKPLNSSSCRRNYLGVCAEDDTSWVILLIIINGPEREKPVWGFQVVTWLHSNQPAQLQFKAS